MAPLLQSLFNFCLAVGHQYLLLASGGVATVAVFLIERHVLKRQISYKAEVCVLAIFIFLACFGAWSDELVHVSEADVRKHDAEQKLNELTKPKLSGTILSYFTGHTSGSQQTDLTFIVKVSNLGAPSVAENWRALIRLPDGRMLAPRATMFSQERMVYTFKNSGPSVLYMEDALLRNANRLIPTNGKATGWITFDVDGFGGGPLPAGTGIHIFFSDSLGSDAWVSYITLTNPQTSPGANAWPGMRLPTAPVK